MHRRVVAVLREHLPPEVGSAEIELMARLAAIALDGLMINLVMRADERAQFQQTWTLWPR